MNELLKIMLMDSEWKLLIECITGCHINAKRFNKCLSIVKSNITNQNYSVITKHEVEKAINGLEEKFTVHLQRRRAERLKHFSQIYFTSHYDGLDYASSALWFLIRLSNNPTSNVLDDKFDDVHLTSSASEVDTQESLTSENVQMKYCRNVSDVSSDISDWSIEDEELLDIFPEELNCNVNDFTTKVVDENITVSEFAIKDVRQPTSVELGVISRKWLHDNLQPSYWKRVVWDGGRYSKQQSANLRLSWETALRDASELNPFGGAMEMSEYQICREVIWLLQGRLDVTICDFQQTKYQYVLSELVCVSHLTRASLCECLAKVNATANIIRRLRMFTESYTINLNDNISTRTFAAFAISLEQILNQFLHKLSRMELEIITQKKTITLMSMLDGLVFWFSFLNHLGKIFTSAFDSSNTSWNSFQKCAHLLNVLYGAVIGLSESFFLDPMELKLIVCIFLKSIRPYFEILDGWISKGRLYDPHDEFIFCRNDASLDEDFLNQCVSIRKDAFGNVSGDAITFLKSVHHRILVVGRSVELLRSLSNLETKNVGPQTKPLYWLIVDGFLSCSGTELNLKVPKECNIMESNDDLSDYSSYLNCFNFNDDHLYKASKNLFKKRSATSDKEEPDIEQLVDAYLSKKNASFADVFLTSFETNFQRKADYISKKLFNVLIDNYNLTGCLYTLRKYFLFEDGETMYRFCVNIFNNMFNNSLTMNEKDLNICLEDVLTASSSEDVSKLKVYLRKEDDTESMRNFGRIFLRYKVEWPLNIIVNSESQCLMDETFTLLLNIKSAKYHLDQLRFADLWSGAELEDNVTGQNMIKAALLLRFRMICIVRTIHDFFLTQILLTSEAAISQMISEASDYQMLIEGYQKYLQVIRESGFATSELLPIKKAIVAITITVIHFSSCWTQGIYSFSWDVLVKMKNDLDTSINFLIGITKWINEKSSNAMLETFADLLKSLLLV